MYEQIHDQMYNQTTKDISVTVTPVFLEDQSEPDEDHFVWAYQVRIEMEGLAPIKRDVLVLADQESRVVIDLNDPDAGLQTAPTSPWGPVLLGSGGMALVGGLVMHLSALSLAEDSRAKSAEAEGYEVLDQFELPASAWTDGYYDRLRPRAQVLLQVQLVPYSHRRGRRHPLRLPGQWRWGY